jgi:hypothetical protein
MQKVLGLRRGGRLRIIPGVMFFALVLLSLSDSPALAQTQDQYGSQTTTQQTGNETTTADGTATIDDANRPNSDDFRCESFLRAVSDDRGALKAQYRGDQLVEHRFQQCLSGNVLTNTIPNRNLPFTGGPPLFAAGLICLWIAALGIVTRVLKP